jgi:hypothetical protein
MPDEVPKDEALPTSEPAPAVTPSQLDRLRSLGYLDYAREPADESERGTVIFDERRTCPGYNLYTIRSLRRTELIDLTGRLVHAWNYGQRGRWMRSVLLPSGELLVVGAESSQRYVMRLTWNGDVVWRRDLPAHHDIVRAPGNRLAVLTLTPRRLPALSTDTDIRDDLVTILSNNGDVQEQRSLYDILSPRPELLDFIPTTLREGVIDLFHANSVRWMTYKHLADKHPIYAPANVIVCIRNQDLVVIFDWDTQELLWAWGQGEISGPHDAAVLEDGSILLFDNGLSRGWSRVIELDPLTRQIVWQYHAPEPRDFFTASRGANQRLPNGNTLITESDSGRAFEVTPQGEIVWEYLVPHFNKEGRRATIIRLYRYEPEFVEGIIARVTRTSPDPD